MYEPSINEQLRLATLERIASYTVGTTVEKNTGIGSGTFVTDGTDRYFLTAAHVIDGDDNSPGSMRVTDGHTIFRISSPEPKRVSIVPITSKPHAL
jgi:S1-C subfamily serine protease